MLDTRMKNFFKEKVRSGKKCLGAWLQMGSPACAEIFANAGFDFVVVDMEHGPHDFMTLGDQLRALRGTDVTPLVRTEWNDFVFAKRVLDIGAMGLHVPYVSTRSEVEQALRSAWYPPKGIRGMAKSTRAAFYGQKPFTEILDVNDQIWVMTAIETPEGLQNVEEIATTPGLDAVFLGPVDLASTHGHLLDTGGPGMAAIKSKIESACFRLGVPLVTISSGMDEAEALFDKGYAAVIAMSDTVFLASQSIAAVERFAKKYR